ncbi:OPT family oligopeptide transporter [Faucicola atlantae]|uniref:OPT family oligopeptide transporter n=1 Tax=Faucicola atlantae TaxID=34059 RepID=UPI0025B211A0|nr:oligopeptide transporter, OPT family [Moraxella atlantae]
MATISNDNLQDLKTGYLVQATPWRQQVALMIGVVVGAMVIAPVLQLLYQAYGFTGALPRPDMDAAQALGAPQATLMTTIAKGIFTHSLSWHYILIGAAIGVVLIVIDALLRKTSAGKYSLPVLAVGMGIYLPPAVNMPIFVGTLLAWWLKRRVTQRAAPAQREACPQSRRTSRHVVCRRFDCRRKFGWGDFGVCHCRIGSNRWFGRAVGNRARSLGHHRAMARYGSVCRGDDCVGKTCACRP